jgi:hypothetical protein
LILTDSILCQSHRHIARILWTAARHLWRWCRAGRYPVAPRLALSLRSTHAHKWE